MRRALVIGFGNTLRRDDGAGPRAAILLGEKYPSLAIVTVHELTPELAEMMSRYAEVVLIDAGAGTGEVELKEIEPRGNAAADSSHSHSPSTLLALCHTLFANRPQRAYLVTIPGYDFSFGESLSPKTEEMVYACVARIGHLIRSGHAARTINREIRGDQRHAGKDRP